MRWASRSCLALAMLLIAGMPQVPIQAQGSGSSSVPPRPPKAGQARAVTDQPHPPGTVVPPRVFGP